MKITNSELSEAGRSLRDLPLRPDDRASNHDPPADQPFEMIIPHGNVSGDPDSHQLGNSPAVPARSFPSWWIHLWAGLVRDPTAKHYRRMGQAVWLYLYLLISANRNDGTVLRRLETIAEQTGFNQRTVARWLQELREQDYITSTSNGRSLRILISKWRPIKGVRNINKN